MVTYLQFWFLKWPEIGKSTGESSGGSCFYHGFFTGLLMAHWHREKMRTVEIYYSTSILDHEKLGLPASHVKLRRSCLLMNILTQEADQLRKGAVAQAETSRPTCGDWIVWVKIRSENMAYG